MRLLEEGRSDEALSLYRALLASHPAEPAIAESRFDDIASDLLDRRLEFDRAIRVFRVEVALYPASANANAGLALAYLRADRRGEAAPFQAKALELFARETKRTEMERLLLGMRIARVKNLAALSDACGRRFLARAELRNRCTDPVLANLPRSHQDGRRGAATRSARNRLLFGRRRDCQVAEGQLELPLVQAGAGLGPVAGRGLEVAVAGQWARTRKRSRR